jgi:hypothetical protein
VYRAYVEERGEGEVVFGFGNLLDYVLAHHVHVVPQLRRDRDHRRTLKEREREKRVSANMN